jgi:26S proteasome regulatory subunit N13
MNQRQQGQGPQEKLFTTLADLLTPASTIPLLDSADEKLLDSLCDCLPPNLLKGVQGAARKDVLRRVLHSPQFSQSLASLTVALREGGLPIISETIGIPVRNGGYLRHGGVPMGGGEAVEAFIEGVKKDVEEQSKQDGEQMDQD